jgi:hypothetical protein
LTRCLTYQIPRTIPHTKKFQYVALDILNLVQPQIDEVTEILHRDSGGLSEQIMFGIHLGKVTHSVFGFYLRHSFVPEGSILCVRLQHPVNNIVPGSFYLASVTIFTLTQNGIATSDNRLHLVDSPSGALPDLPDMKTVDTVIRNIVHRLHSCVKIWFGEAVKPDTPLPAMC